MMTILHVSDLHFGPPYVPRVGAALQRAAHALDPDLVVASGDFTQRAKPEEFEEAAEYLDALPDTPQVVIPGNHDVPLYRVVERIFSPYKWYRKYIAEELDQVVRTDDAVVVALNSTAPLRHITNGRISPSQLDFCREAFEGVGEDAVRIVVAHHHFAPAPDYEGGQVMPRAKRAIDAFTRLEVDLVLGGHLHRAYIGNSLDLYPGSDRDHGIIVVQSGTTTSRRGRVREREKNSFNLIRVTEEVIRITHYMYFEDTDGFASVSRHIFPRSPIAYFSDTATTRSESHR
ncbi:MAG: metallophosphoesterase family protein [Longimicrobiales bacterium]|nr:metallophosphoesterase family protein [Longimicrobiales bacterium]